MPMPRLAPSRPPAPWRPASRTRLSPREMPMPALAPSRQPEPIETTCFPPPERGPMIEAPPPTSLSAPTTTPHPPRRLPPAGGAARGRRAAADVAVGADHDAGADPALDHRRAEGAGVVVDE